MDKEKLLAFWNNKNNKIKLVVAIGLVGILLIMISEFIPGKDKNSSTNTGTSAKAASQQTDIVSYTEKSEKELSNIISKISGVGECSVMITFENTKENVYAINSSTQTDEKGEKHEYNYVVIDSENGDEPIIVKEIQPKVKGVVIVCQGGDDIKVKAAVGECVRSAFDISSTRISVNKMKVE